MSIYSLGKYQVAEQPLVLDAAGSLHDSQDSETGERVFVKWLRHQPGRRQSAASLHALHGLAAPALVVPHDEVASGAERFVVAPQPEGELLSSCLSRLRASGIWGRHQMLSALVDVCKAVDALHQANLVHGAIHPGSIVLTLGGEPHGYLLCFEQFVPRATSTYLDSNEQVLYLAQEQLRGAGDPASDIYALGVMLYACFSVQAPFEGTSTYDLAEKIVWGDFAAFTPSVTDFANYPPLLDTIRPDLEAIGGIAMRALQRDASARFATVAEITGQLEQIARRINPVSLAHSFYREDRFELALHVLNEVLKYQESTWEVQAMLGRIHGFKLPVSRENYEQASLAYKRAIEADPERLDSHLELAELYTRYGRHSGAQREFAYVLNSGRRDLYTMMGYAAVLERTGDHTSSLNVLRTLQREAPYHLPIYIQAIRASIEHQDLNDALADCDAALKRIAEVIHKGNLPPRHVADIYYLRGLLMRMRDNTDAASSWARKALEHDNKHLEAHNLLIVLSMEQGDTESAIDHFLMSMVLDPEQANLLEVAARLFPAVGTPDDDAAPQSEGSSHDT